MRNHELLGLEPLEDFKNMYQYFRREKWEPGETHGIYHVSLSEILVEPTWQLPKTIKIIKEYTKEEIQRSEKSLESVWILDSEGRNMFPRGLNPKKVHYFECIMAAAHGRFFSFLLE